MQAYVDTIVRNPPGELTITNLQYSTFIYIELRSDQKVRLVDKSMTNLKVLSFPGDMTDTVMCCTDQKRFSLGWSVWTKKTFTLFSKEILPNTIKYEIAWALLQSTKHSFPIVGFRKQGSYLHASVVPCHFNAAFPRWKWKPDNQCIRDISRIGYFAHFRVIEYCRSILSFFHYCGFSEAAL